MKTPTRRTAHRLAAVLAIATAFAATGAWAEDWTVSESTTLTADTTVDALTVEEGVTLDLNGYKLYCTSLAGSGTITSTSTDLTSPDTDGTHVTWSWLKDSDGTSVGTPANGSAAALFNDDYSSWMGDNRLRLGGTVNLQPFTVCYDFGEDTPAVVNQYKITNGGSGGSYRNRSPYIWDFDASNDGDIWVNLHNVEKNKYDDIWSEIKQTKTYAFENTTAYRYYRIVFKKTGTSDLELKQLEYFNTNPGELHVNVPAGAEATVGSLTISGNMKVVKDGEGRLNGVTGIGSNTFPGVLEVNAGTVYVDEDFKLGTTADGTLTINGGTVEVNSIKAMHIGASSGKTGTVNLNGGILKTKRLVNLTGATGRVNFDGGTLQANNTDNNGLFGNKVVVTVNERGGTIDSGNIAVTVPAAISGTGAMRFKGGNTITHNAASTYTGGTTIELGTKIVTSNETAKNTILANLAIDGRSQFAEADDIEVFQYTTGGLTNSYIANVNKVYCGSDTSVEVSDDGKKILVDFKLPIWELTADATWSSLVETYGAPDADVIVRIASSGGYTLTIDTDVTVSQIVFSGTNPDVVVNTGATVTTDTITFASGSNYLKNDGVIVLNGTATTSLPFHNDSRGAYYINNGGRVNVSSVTTGSTTPGLVPEGTNQFVCVGVDGMYDVSAVANNTASVRLAEGATIANGDSTISPTAKQVPQLILDGDAQAKNYRSFGLTLNGSETRLDLGEHTLKIFGGGDTYSFFLYNTTVSGTGKVFVESGKLATYGNTHGDSWSLEIGTSGYFALANTPSGNTLTVGDFVNNGTDSSDSGAGALVVKGALTPGNAIKKLTLADGATVKATGTAQTVSTTFSASGTITVDASGITKEQLDAGNVAVLTVPSSFNTSSVTWNVSGEQIAGTRAKWRTDGTIQTLYLCKPIGLMVIFR